MKPTHSHRLETWLGPAEVQRISWSMRDWPGPPIAVQGVPGNVWAMPGGDFGGPCDVGYSCDWRELVSDWWRRRMKHPKFNKLNTGFASLSDLMSEGQYKRQTLLFSAGATGNPGSPTGGTPGVESYWAVSTGNPAAGTAGSAAPGGRNPASTDGGIPHADAASGDTLHCIGGQFSIIPNTNQIATLAGGMSPSLLMYDRLFDVAKTMASTGTEAVTGTLTRYTSTTAGATDYVGGNFCFVEVGTQLANTSHNWTVCKYTNQAATTGQSFPSAAGTPIALANSLDHGGWFLPFATGDYGVRALSQMQCSASLASGTINFVIGHPIAWFPIWYNANKGPWYFEGIRTAFNFCRIYDSACLHFLGIFGSSTSQGIPYGHVTLVSG